MTVGYRVEADGVAVVYLVDHEPFSDELWRADAEPGRIESILHEGDRRHAKFMADADLVIHDAQYTPEEYGPKKTWGHSTYDYVVQIAAAAGVRRVALTHHDPSHNDHFVADIERRARTLAAGVGRGLDHRRYRFSQAGAALGRVARQYCGQLGKQDNCQVAVSLSLANLPNQSTSAQRLANCARQRGINWSIFDARQWYRGAAEHNGVRHARRASLRRRLKLGEGYRRKASQ